MRTVALIPILVLLMTCTALAQKDAPCPKPELTICAPMVVDSVEIKEETTAYSIQINYPVLCDPDATRTMRDHVTRSLADFKKDSFDNGLPGASHMNSMAIEYAVWPAAKGRLASVKLQVMVYTGGAHPNNWPVTWVFDLTDGEPLALDEIFKDPNTALQDIAHRVRTTLSHSLGEMLLPDMLNDGTTAVAANYADYIMNDEGMVFFFAPYQVAPYAAGQQVVTIPWKGLKKHLRPEIRKIVM